MRRKGARAAGEERASTEGKPAWVAGAHTLHVQHCLLACLRAASAVPKQSPDAITH
jgi:hypothetical protein